jgi:hypothetical protein
MVGALPHSQAVGGRREAGGARGGGSDWMGGDSESETIGRRHVADSDRVACSTSTRTQCRVTYPNLLPIRCYSTNHEECLGPRAGWGNQTSYSW